MYKAHIKIFFAIITATALAQIEDKFKQLDQEIATPNSYKESSDISAAKTR